VDLVQTGHLMVMVVVVVDPQGQGLMELRPPVLLEQHL
jgi:hypothetical protein